MTLQKIIVLKNCKKHACCESQSVLAVAYVVVQKVDPNRGTQLGLQIIPYTKAPKIL